MRYLILVFINIPIILLGLLNIITKYKLGSLPQRRFRFQITLWSIALVVLIGSFPLYNLFKGKDILYSAGLSLLDIAQTTIIVLLLYILLNLKQRQEQTERRLHDLHQELSIILGEIRK